MEPGGDGSSAPKPSSTLKCSNYSLIQERCNPLCFSYREITVLNFEIKQFWMKLKISVVWQDPTYICQISPKFTFLYILNISLFDWLSLNIWTLGTSRTNRKIRFWTCTGSNRTCSRTDWTCRIRWRLTWRWSWKTETNIHYCLIYLISHFRMSLTQFWHCSKLKIAL